MSAPGPDAQTVAVCDLCGLPADPPVTAADDGAGDSGGEAGDAGGTYCCRGCLQVDRALDSVPDRRDAVTDRVDREAAEGPAAEARSGGTVADAVPAADAVPTGAERCFLAVDGMHCSTCEAFLEATADGVDGVHDAAASYATDMMRVTYDPERTDPAAIARGVSGYGYAANVRERVAEHADDSSAAAFLVSGGFFGMMVMLWYVLFLYPTYLGYEPLVDLGGAAGLYLHLNVWVFASVVLFVGGWPLLRGAVVSLRARRPNMDLLVSLAAVSAYACSTVALALGETHLYFDVSVAVVLAVTFGNHYEDRVKRSAAGMLAELGSERVDEAARHPGGETVPVSALEPGDEVRVRTGERVPVDGTVEAGRAAVDEALVTGESVPVEKAPGDDVVGGSVVTDNPLVVAVGPSAASTHDRLVDMLWEIQASRPGVQRLADRIATVFIPLVLLLAAGAFAAQLAVGTAPTAALLTALTVLIVSCPCALGLATPLAVAAGIRDLASHGAVVTSPAVFEALPDVDVVVFDKTGTLTTGEMRVHAVHVAQCASTGGDSGEAVLSRAAAVEAYANHPIARAIVAAAHEPNEPNDWSSGQLDVTGASGAETNGSLEATDVTTHPDGVSGTVGGDRVVVGHPDRLAAAGLALGADPLAADQPAADQPADATLLDAIDEARSAGHVPVCVGWGGRVRGVVVVGDTPRDGWEDVIAAVGADREVVVLTGDDERAASRFREAAGVDEVFAGVPPEAKARTVERLRSRGTVAMVGDGSNDAPALAAADVGIAMGGASALAGDAADVVLTTDDLGTVPTVFKVASATHRRVRVNLGWAFGYNAVAIPIAVAGLLNPLFAAVAMAASSLVVVINSARPLVASGTTRPSGGQHGRDHAGPTDGGRSMVGGGASREQ